MADEYLRTDNVAVELRRELEASEARFRTMVERNADAIIVVDLDGILRFMNPAAERLFQRNAQEFIGEGIGLPVVAGETTEIEVVPLGGRIRAVEMRAVETHWERRRVYLATLRDITERKEAQVEREALIAELEAKNEELEQFTYTVSHDLKSPLITIKGFIGMLEKDIAGGDTENVCSDISRIADAADKMTRLLDDLLELSRIGRIINPPEKASISDLAADAVLQIGGRLVEMNVKVNIDPDMPLIYCDRTRMLEVLKNLMDNAAKYTGEQTDPRIEIGVERKAGEDVFFVRDNGMGIESCYKEKIFGLFEMLDPASEGTGIGLAIVKRIIEVHGGRIWVESEGLGKGSIFYFTLSEHNGAGGIKDAWQ